MAFNGTPSAIVSDKANKIVVVVPAGATTGFNEITTGPDRALWFTNDPSVNRSREPGSIGRITTAGLVTGYTVAGIRDPHAITAGRDGALWFTNVELSADRGETAIGRMTMGGAFNTYTVTGINMAVDIAAGPMEHFGSPPRPIRSDASRPT